MRSCHTIPFKNPTAVIKIIKIRFTIKVIRIIYWECASLLTIVFWTCILFLNLNFLLFKILCFLIEKLFLSYWILCVPNLNNFLIFYQWSFTLLTSNVLSDFFLIMWIFNFFTFFGEIYWTRTQILLHKLLFAFHIHFL